MDRENAIAYLTRKGKIGHPTETKEKKMTVIEEFDGKREEKQYTEEIQQYKKEDEEEISKVIRHGKIYGDPYVELG